MLSGSTVAQLMTGDINGDGRTDIIYPFYDSSRGLVIRVKMSKGNGTFTHSENVQGDGMNNSNTVALLMKADVNGDKKMDILYPFYNEIRGLTVRTKLSNGYGSFTHIETVLGDGM